MVDQGQGELRGAESLRATCGSANLLDGAPTPGLLQIETQRR